jgi:hypothetical protein
MITGHARRIGRRGAVESAALAALAALGCAAPAVQPPATRAALERLAAAATTDAYRHAVALAPLFAGRAVLYFFRTDCEYCAAGLAAARALAMRPGAPTLVLVSREGPARLRAALGPALPRRLVVLSDSAGALMDAALVTRYVPRIVAVAAFRVLLDQTGQRGPGLVGAVRIATAWGRSR